MALKRPKKTPGDEILLAIALQEANARGLEPAMGDYFFDHDYDLCRADSPTLKACCAVGALVLGGVGRKRGDRVFGFPHGVSDQAIAIGNDDVNAWDEETPDRGETLGHAFQLAMGGVL